MSTAVPRVLVQKCIIGGVVVSALVGRLAGACWPTPWQAVGASFGGFCGTDWHIARGHHDPWGPSSMCDVGQRSAKLGNAR